MYLVESGARRRLLRLVVDRFERDRDRGVLTFDCSRIVSILWNVVVIGRVFVLPYCQ